MAALSLLYPHQGRHGIGSYVYYTSSLLGLPPCTAWSERLAGPPDCTGSGVATSLSGYPETGGGGDLW